MTKIGGQDRKARAGSACPVVIGDGADSKAVPKIMNPWSTSRRARNDAAMVQQFLEDRLHARIAQSFGGRTDQQGRRVPRIGAVISA